MSSKIPCNGIFRVTCEFGRKGKTWKAGYHTGIDIVNDDFIVYSTCNGKIYNMGFDASYGNFIVIADDTPNDVHYHWYCHLSRILINMGDEVTPETKIGIMGKTGNATGIHLHYEIRNKLNTYGVVDNPADYMGIPNKVGTYNEQDYQQEVYEEKVLARNTNLRSEPTLNSNSKDLQISGTHLFILEKTVNIEDGYLWDKVRMIPSGKIGYMINKNYRK